jgi:mono/diheme cytochrome c family protein
VAEVVGDARAGQAYFNRDGQCGTCHSPTGPACCYQSRQAVILSLPTEDSPGMAAKSRPGGDEERHNLIE